MSEQDESILWWEGGHAEEGEKADYDFVKRRRRIRLYIALAFPLLAAENRPFLRRPLQLVLLVKLGQERHSSLKGGGVIGVVRGAKEMSMCEW
jgi:hypothetical protein